MLGPVFAHAVLLDNVEVVMELVINVCLECCLGDGVVLEVVEWLGIPRAGAQSVVRGAGVLVAAFTCGVGGEKEGEIRLGCGELRDYSQSASGCPLLGIQQVQPSH